MKKPSKPAPKIPAKKAPAIKQSAAKSKAKPSSKPKPRKTQGQTELLPILERLAQSVERLAQAAEQLAEAAVHQPSPLRTEEREESFKTLSESIAEAAKNENE